MTSSPPKSICVIGAGPSGLSMLHALTSDDISSTYSITCFEKQSDWGGQWNYDWRTGIDKHGLPIHNSMHKDLWSNIPKECVEYPDYTYKKHFDVSIPSFPPRDVMRHYFVGRAKKCELRQFIQFSRYVKECTYSNNSRMFTVKTIDLETNMVTKHVFDHVIVCTGHFSQPNIPEWEGIDTFTGRIVHSHDLRTFKDLQSKKVLVVGTSYSAEDVACELYKNEVKDVTLCWRTAKMEYIFPGKVKHVPELIKINRDLVYFKDESNSKFDVIIVCTGYKHHFPFMSAQLRLKTENKLCPDGLYDGCVFIENPNLFYIGMQDQYFTLTMFDTQAWLIREIIKKNIVLPSKARMKYYLKEDQDDESKLDNTYTARLLYQANYIKKLISQTNYPEINFDGIIQVFLEWKSNKIDDIIRYRDKQHTSQITGQNAQEHSREWIIEDVHTVRHFINAAYLPKYKNQYYKRY